MWNKVGFNFNRDDFKRKTENRLILWNRERFILRLLEKDPSLWVDSFNKEIPDRLGWLTAPKNAEKELKEIKNISDIIKEMGISYIVLLGMGGSSLAAQMLYETLDKRDSSPELFVLSSTHPVAVQEIETNIDIKKTVFIVSSKSGTTLETLSFFRYFWSLASRSTSETGRHFIAVTDPGSNLDRLAQKRNFIKIFYAPPDIGGRFSAFTFFGSVPPFFCGADIKKLIFSAQKEMNKNIPSIPEQEADGIVLGALLGEMALAGKDKLTFMTDNSLAYFPYWLEQLIAESLGKKGKGIIPVVDEPSAPLNYYGDDRVFINITLGRDDQKENKQFINTLNSEGFPVLDFNLENKFSLGRELYRWEIAVAAAGAVLGVNPFDQPDVQRSKEFTRKAMEKNGIEKIRGIRSYSIEDEEEIKKAMREIFQDAEKDRYFSLQAYLPKTGGLDRILEDIRLQFLQKTGLATTLGYGPSFLHSSGQLHKGGPDLGIFIQIVDDIEFDLTVPETDYSFLSMIKAQAAGDYQALQEKRRKIIRINLGNSVETAMETFLKIIRKL